MELDLESINIVDATFTDMAFKNLIMVYYTDVAGNYNGIAMDPNDDSEFSKKVFEKFTIEDIERNTITLHEDNINKAKEFAQFIEYKQTGKITVNNENEVEQEPLEITLESLEKAQNETLFKIKLDIFNKEEFQESGNKELRTNIRKSSSLVELMHHYHIFKQLLDNDNSK